MINKSAGVRNVFTVARFILKGGGASLPSGAPS